ncbi:hypothetical protein [Paenarthrobacter sp. Y-19]|uniref:hypothetical protein n=1 Tax=Paenarthrobacter sp. Y-19 TaxID=3031125 RepID=UPI0023DAB2E2|nr:hypothetical protein [Paenarthrobacter sp. Y-19]
MTNMTQQPSIRDILAAHWGDDAIKQPLTLDLNNPGEAPEPVPALNSPELKKSIIQAIADNASQQNGN